WLPFLLGALLLAPALGRFLGPAVVVGAAGCGVGLLRRRTTAGARMARTADAVRESCEALAGELVAGTTPGQALSVAVEVWPPLEEAVHAERVGDSVPDALRDLAERHDGAGDLRQVAAAWQLSQRSGAALGEALTAVAADLADQRTTRALVRGELASARSTARLVACLPVLT